MGTDTNSFAGRSTTHRRRGAMFVYMLAGLVAIMLFASLAIDYGRMQVAKSEVQAAAYAAARAGGQTMMNGGDMTSIVADTISTARQNVIDGKQVVIRSGDVKLGVYFPDTKQFVETADTTVANALRINLTHTFGTDSGSLSFLPIFDAGPRSVTAQSTIMIETEGFDTSSYTYLLTTPGTSGGTAGTPGTSSSGTTTTTTTTTSTVITEADAGTIVSSWTPPAPEPAPAPAPDPTPAPTVDTSTSTWTTYTPPTPDTTWSTPTTTTEVTVVAPPPAPAKKMVVVN